MFSWTERQRNQSTMSEDLNFSFARLLLADAAIVGRWLLRAANSPTRSVSTKPASVNSLRRAILPRLWFENVVTPKVGAPQFQPTIGRFATTP